ncbi:hypothetical protein K466DRAFT_606849, partial [Polyporus arcularius HHB13444]
MAKANALQLPGSDSEVDTFLTRWRSESPHKLNLQFAQSVSRMWRVHKVRQDAANLFELNIALERRRLMLCNAAAWTWLTVHVVDAASPLVDQLVRNRRALSTSTDWLERLVRDIFLMVRSRKPGDLRSEHYLPDLDVPPAVVRVRGRQVPLSETVAVVTGEVVQALENWLQFPSRSQLFAACFVIHVLNTVQNDDALLLQPVWLAHQEVRAQVLGRRKARVTALAPADLQPFISAFESLPIASPDSTESELLRQISYARARCIPHLQEITATLLPLLPSQNTSSSSTSLVSPNPFPAKSRPRSTRAAVPCNPTSHGGADIPALVEFIRDAMAVVRNPTPQSFSPVQQKIASNLDRFLPMREHGCSRQK